MGSLTAGNAAKGDQMVFVLGSFLFLVLRRQRDAKIGIRWSIVGLVVIGLDEKEKGGVLRTKRRSCARMGQ